MKAYAKLFRALATAVAGTALGVSAQTGANSHREPLATAQTNVVESATPTIDTTVLAKPAPPKVWLSPATSAIVRMTEAGIDKAVIKAYVENLNTAPAPTANEIIYLGEHGIPLEVITAYVQRAHQLQEQAAQGAETQPPLGAPSIQPQSPTYALTPPTTNPTYTYSYPSPAYPYTDYSGYDYSTPDYSGGYPAYGGYPYYGYGYSYPYWGFGGYSFVPGFGLFGRGFDHDRYSRPFGVRGSGSVYARHGFGGQAYGSRSYAGALGARGGAPFSPPLRSGYGTVGSWGGGVPVYHSTPGRAVGGFSGRVGEGFGGNRGGGFGGARGGGGRR